MRILALDLSKRSTGWALCAADDQRVTSGVWELGSEFTSNGRVFGNLHARMSELHSLGAIEAVYYEEALDPRTLSGHTNIDTLRLLSGLSAHAESWGEAMRCRIIRAVNQVTWRRHFLGAMKRGTKSATLKDFAMERCRQFGLKPSTHDQAEALGLLSYALDQHGIVPPWERDQVLRQPLGALA